MLRKKLLLNSCIAVIIILSLVMSSNIMMVSAKEDNVNDSEYIVLTNDNESLDKAMELSNDSEILMQSEDNGNTVSKLTLSAYDVSELNSTDGVEKIEKNITLQGDSVDEVAEDPLMESLFKEIDTEDINQWNLDSLGIDQVEQNTNNKVKIELLDSGVSLSKDIDVKRRINLVDEDDGVNPLYEDYSQHGTGMAGVICAKDNGIYTTGINPNAELYSVKALDENIKAPLSRIIEGIYWGIDNDMDIINMSFGTTTNSSILHRAIRDAYENGIVLVAASGNNSNTEVQYPAGYDEVISVGAQNPEGGISDFSSVGENLDIIAPGEKIETTGIFGTVNGTSGTSIATAQVTGVASLILEKDKTKSPDFVKKLLVYSAKEVRERGIVTGVVDCDYALKIYDDFTATYTPTAEIQQYENSEKIGDYDTDGYVKGLWTMDAHEDIAFNTGIDFSRDTNALNLIIKGARIADSQNGAGYNFKKIKALHGDCNYVASMKIVWKFIQLMKQYENIDTAYDRTGAMMLNLPAYNNGTEGQVEEYDDLLSTLSLLDAINFSEYLPNDEYYHTNSNETIRFVKYKAMGLFIHLVGDIFAHRSVVPPSYRTQIRNTSFQGETPFDNNPEYSIINDITVKKKIINASQSSEIPIEFRNIQCLRNAIYYGYLECRKIKKFSKFYYEGNNCSHNKKTSVDDFLRTILLRYEDNTDFIESRYNEAFYNCYSIFDELSNTDFDYRVFFYYSGDFKLYNYKNYVANAGFDTTLFTSDEWNNNTVFPIKYYNID